MTEHTHTISIDAKVDLGGFKNLSKTLEDIQSSVEKLEKGFKNLSGFSVDLDTKGAISGIDELVSKTSDLDKSLKDVHMGSLAGITSDAGEAADELKAVESVAGDVNTSLNNIDAKGLKDIESSASTATNAVKTLDSQFGSLNKTAGSITANGFDSITSQASSASQAVDSLISKLGELDVTLDGIDGSGLESIASSADDATKSMSNLSGSTSSTSTGLDGTGVLSYLGLGTAIGTITDVGGQKEINKITSSLKGYDNEAIDTKTTESLVSMQDVIPAMNAIQTATGATSDQMNDSMNTIVDFGTYVSALTGNSTLAANAMYDLAKGCNGAFASLDQYGLTKESVMAAGWSGEEDDFEGYMAAVAKLTPDSSNYMDTFQGAVIGVQKAFSSAAGEIAQEVLPPITQLIQGFLSLNTAMGGLPIKALLVGFTAFSAIRPLGDMIRSFRELKNGISGAMTAWSGFKNAIQEGNGIRQALRNMTDPCKDTDTCAEKLQKQEEGIKGVNKSAEKQKGPKTYKVGSGDMFNGKGRVNDDYMRKMKGGDSATGKLQKSLKNASSGIASTARGIGTSISTGITAGMGALSGVGSTITGSLSSVAGSVTSMVGSISSSITSMLGGLRSSIGSVASSLTSTMTSALSGMRSSITGIASSLTGGLSKAFSGVTGTVSSAMSGITGSMTGSVASASGKMGSSFSKILPSITSMAGPAAIGIAGIGAAALVATAGIHKLGFSWGDVWNMMKQGDMSDLTDSINNAVSGVVDKLKNTDWSQLASNIMHSIGQLFTGIDWLGLLGGLVTGLGSAITGILSGIGSAIMDTDWAGVLTGIYEGLKGALTNIDWSGIASTIWNGLMSALGSIGDLAGGIWEFIKGLFTGGDAGGDDGSSVGSVILDLLRSGIQWAFSNIGSIFSGLGGALVQGLSSALGGIDISGMLSGLVSGLSGVWQTISSTATDVWNGIKTTISSAVDSIVGFLDKLAETAGKVWDKVQQGLDTLKGALGLGGGGEDAGAEVASAATEGGGDITVQVDTTQAQAQVQALTDMVNNSLTTLNNAITNIMAQMDAALGSMFTQMGAQIQAVMTQMVTQIQTVLTNMVTALTTEFTTFTTTMTTQFTTMFTSIQTSSDMLWTSLSTGIQTANTSLMTFNTSLTQFNTSIQMAGSQLMVLVQYVAQLIVSLQQLCASVVMVSAAFQTGFSGINAIVSSTLSEALATANNFRAQIVSTMQSAATDSVNAFNSAFSGIKDTIASEMDGAIQTMREKGDELAQAAGDAARKATQEYQNNLDIGSPGLIWRMTESEMGGTVNAMETAGSLLAKASSQAGKDTVDAYLENTTGGIVGTPVINTPEVAAPAVQVPATAENERGGNSTGYGDVTNNFNITGEFDSDKRVNQLVEEITKAMTFENNRAGRTVGTIYKG